MVGPVPAKETIEAPDRLDATTVVAEFVVENVIVSAINETLPEASKHSNSFIVPILLAQPERIRSLHHPETTSNRSSLLADAVVP